MAWKISQRKSPKTTANGKWTSPIVVQLIKKSCFNFKNHLCKSYRMNENISIIDISLDEQENVAQITPITTLPLNMIRALKLSGSCTKATKGSGESLDSLASTFRSEYSPRKFGIDNFPQSQKKNSFLSRRASCP